MKEFWKKCRFLWTALLIFCLMTPEVLAAGDSSITICHINGDAEILPGSGYTETDLFSDFKNLLPGDVRIETITVRNRCDGRKPLRLYLKALPHDISDNPLSPSIAVGETIDSAENFLSHLQLKVWVRDALVFQDKASVGLEGTIPLGYLPYDASIELKVELSVPLTLDNEYAGRMGEIDWAFLLADESDITPDDTEQLTVRKLWSDGNGQHTYEDAVTVFLLRDGEPCQSAVLHPGNQWSFCFSDLDDNYTWTVQEISKMEGYVTQYERDGQIFTIVNQLVPPEEPQKPQPESYTISVMKKWADSDQSHPSYVECTLFHNEDAVESIRLSDDNGWTHTWTELEGTATWQVLETYCEGFFVPTYVVDENGWLIITNTEHLIQTGQPRWIVPLLAGCGLLLMSTGILMRRRHEN